MAAKKTSTTKAPRSKKTASANYDHYSDIISGIRAGDYGHGATMWQRLTHLGYTKQQQRELRTLLSL